MNERVLLGRFAVVITLSIVVAIMVLSIIIVQIATEIVRTFVLLWNQRKGPPDGA